VCVAAARGLFPTNTRHGGCNIFSLSPVFYDRVHEKIIIVDGHRASSGRSRRLTIFIAIIVSPFLVFYRLVTWRSRVHANLPVLRRTVNGVGGLKRKTKIHRLTFIIREIVRSGKADGGQPPSSIIIIIMVR